MGKALAILTEEALEGKSIVVDTLTWVISAVHWQDFDENAYGARANVAPAVSSAVRQRLSGECDRDIVVNLFSNPGSAQVKCGLVAP
jgi:hypothetical protein